MTITDTLSNALTSHVYRNTPYTSPTLYVGLLNASGVELSGSGYARAPVGSAFPAPTNGVTINDATITFPNTATAAWAPALFLAFYDASTGGNLLQTTPFVAPVVVQNGKRLRFPAGQITVAFGTVPDGRWASGNIVQEPALIVEAGNEVLMTRELTTPFEYPVQVVP